MQAKKSSKLFLKRLELYLAYLKSMPDAVTYISAKTIAKTIDLGEVQVRKDLARVSCGGRKKLGHLRTQLIRDVEYFLVYGNVTYAVVVGAGKLGQALMSHSGFEQAGIHLLAGFDVRPVESCSAGGKSIYPMASLESFCADHHVQVGIITVPRESAQEVCDSLISCGIGAIWNFAPISLTVPDHILVQNENLALSANALRLQLRNLDGKGSLETFQKER